MSLLTSRHLLWIGAFLLFGILFNSGSVALFDVDEGAFSEATREMVASGNWSATYLDGQPRYDKPILTYWLQGISISVFGLTEITLRLHAILSTLLWGLAIYLFCREFIERRTGLVALTLFSSILIITVIGRSATADALLNLFIALTFFDIYRYSQSQRRTHLYRTWLWLSLGVLTKGPVAAAIPLIVSGLWFASQRRQRDWLGAVFSPLGWLILVAVVAPWLLLVWQDQGAGFFRGFLIEHNLNRFTQTKEGHGGHWYYYLAVLPLILLPYSGMLASLLLRVRALWARPFERLLLLWFAVVFVLVSASGTQLPHYMLYGVTPLLILFAKYRKLYARQHWQWLFPAGYFVLQVALVLSADGLAAAQDNAYLREMLAWAPAYLDNAYLGAALAALGVIAWLATRRWPMWKKLALAALLQSAFTSAFLLPAIAGLQQEPIRQAALVARGIDAPFVAHGIHMPSFSVYRGTQTLRREVRPGDYVYTRADRLDGLAARFGAAAVEVFYRKGGIVLARISALPPEEAADGR